MTMTNDITTKCGYISLIGAPNSGKSTLVNSLVGCKVSIVSPKVQTTRNIVRGITTFDHCQAILVDTPGIFKPANTLEKKIVKNAWTSAGQSDYQLLICDISAGKPIELTQLIEALNHKKLATSAVINKVDLAKGTQVEDLRNYLAKQQIFEHILPISAKCGSGLDDLKELIAEKLPSMPFIYDEDDCSDQPARLLANDVTREKLFYLLGQEVPYAVNVETESYKEQENGEITIRQVITVMRESQKKIVIGQGGAMLKKIGAQSRTELSKLFDTKVHLFLFVRVRADWAEKAKRSEL
ncbi:MAG: GTPase Era [Pseudomonadota bacterium]